MGCHSWFYVHLPERKDELEKDFLTSHIETAKWWYDYCLESPADEWDEGCDKDSVDYWKSKSLEEHYLNLSWPKDTINEEYEYALAETPEQRREVSLKYAKLKYEKCLSSTDLEEINRVVSMTEYIVVNGKVYIDCTNEALTKKYGVDLMHDMFRIHDYSANSCSSVEDVLNRCAAHNVILSQQEREGVVLWFEKYPDTIIRFA